MKSVPGIRPQFSRLQRALLRRWVAHIDPRLRLEIVALTLLVWGFVFWRSRLFLDGLASTTGRAGPALGLAGELALLVLAAAVGAAAQHRRQLRRPLGGPEWLALPVPPEPLLAHAAWRAQMRAVWIAALSPPLLAAAFGRVPVWAIAGLTALFVAGLWAGNHFATGLVERGARARAARTQGPAPDSAWPLLTAAVRSTPPPRIRAPRWHRGPTVLAMMLKDLRLSWRRTSAWRPWPVWLVLAPASALAWWFATMPGGLEPALGRFVAFGLALVAAAALADSLIALAARDPAPVLKSLPLHAGDVWLSRFLLVLGFTAALTAGHAVAARWLPAGPLQVHLIWLAAATLAIGMLGVHYGMTMPPAAAARVLTLTLTIATAASIMIPLLGWILLLAAVIHSARRVPRWSYLEEIP